MQLVYEAGWQTYEEWGAIRIYEDVDGCFHVEHGGRSVYSSHKDPDWEEPYVAPFETVLELIEEWDQIEKENEEYWNRNGGY